VIKQLRIVPALLLILSTTLPSYASFEELPTGARQAGLGNAFTAIADDVYATYYNPAGLAQLHRSEFSAYYAKLYSGLTDGSSIGRSYIAYGHPTQKHGTFGFSFLDLSLAGLYSENTFALHYATALRERWNLGASAKLLKKSFGSDAYTQNAINSDADSSVSLGHPDPLFAANGTSKTAISFDVGTQYRISRIYGLGLAILNINSPNMALSPSDTDQVASVYKAGLARRTKTSAVDAEISMRKFTTEEYRFNIGGERWLKDSIAVRAGLGFGQRQYQVTSVGFSYKWEALQLDYALIYPLTGIKGTFGTNQLSMTFRFGRKN
jgi:hypothetical protein